MKQNNSADSREYEDEVVSKNYIARWLQYLQEGNRKRNKFDRALTKTFAADVIRNKTDAFLKWCEEWGISLKNKWADAIVQYAKKYDKIALLTKTLFHSPRLAKWTNNNIHYTSQGAKKLKDFIGRHSTKTAAIMMITGMLSYYNSDGKNEKKVQTDSPQVFGDTMDAIKTMTTQDSIHVFGDYVATHVKLQSLDTVNSAGKEIKTAFGKYARFMRYEKEFDQALEEYGPSLQKDLVRWLAITEWEGNPVSINSMDGGAGILHIQPDVAKKDFHMKVFTDNKKYKQYDFYLLKKQGMSKHEIYALHGKILKKILAENDGLSHVASLDDRFHPKHCLEKVVKQLEKNYHLGVTMAKEKPALMKELKQYAKNIWQDRKQLYALNAFNKWPKSGHLSFTYWDEEKLRGHLENVLLHTSEYQEYDKIVKDGSAQWKEKEGLWQYLLEETAQ